MNAMDVLASPSAEEAFGLAVVEAMASGLPVLYVSCPAIEDLPPDASAGCPPRPGGAESFVRALLDLRTQGPRSRAVPAAAQHYCITRSAAQLMDVYAAAVSSTPSPTPSLGVSSA